MDERHQSPTVRSRAAWGRVAAASALTVGATLLGVAAPAGAACAPGATCAQPGLVLSVPFDDDASGTTARDASGSGHTATLESGATFAATGQPAGGQPAGALATNDGGFADVPVPVVDTSQPFTLEAFVNFSKDPSGYRTLVSLDGTSQSAVFLQFRPDGFGCVTAGVDDSLGESEVRSISDAPVSGGRWYHLACTASEGNVTLYVDGVAQPTAVGAVPFQATGPTVIAAGKFGGDRTDFVAGLVDDVKVFDHARTPSEILADSQGIESTAPSATVPEARLAVLLPLGAAALAAGAVLHRRRRPAPSAR